MQANLLNPAASTHWPSAVYVTVEKYLDREALAELTLSVLTAPPVISRCPSINPTYKISLCVCGKGGGGRYENDRICQSKMYMRGAVDMGVDCVNEKG